MRASGFISLAARRARASTLQRTADKEPRARNDGRGSLLCTFAYILGYRPSDRVAFIPEEFLTLRGSAQPDRFPSTYKLVVFYLTISAGVKLLEKYITCEG